MNMPETVRGWFIDDNGEWVKGLENSHSAYELLDAFELPRTWENIIKAQHTIRRILGKALRDGLKAGGIGHSPKMYFIAKNPKEERLILMDALPMKLGHMKRTEQLTADIEGLKTKSITSSRKMLESWANLEEGKNLLT